MEIHNYVTNNYMCSTFVRYEKPRIAFFNGCIKEIHGMLIITTMTKTGKNKSRQLDTYRQPLEGESLIPTDTLNEFDSENEFYFLPEDKILDDDALRTLVSRGKGNAVLLTLLGEVATKGYQYKPSQSQMTVTLDYSERFEQLHIYSDAFCLTFDKIAKEKIQDISPADILDLLELKGFMKIPFVFQTSDETDIPLEETAQQLDEWMKAYEKGILIHSDDDISICNDGKYTYSDTLGRIRMTQEEFIKKFPDANKF